MHIIDKYIIKKFLGTFFFSLTLILAISVIWDVSERIDDFIEKKAPLHAIIFDYYLHFIPYFASILSPLFVFIAVIFFTAKMASNTEIIAILSSGMSFRRLMRPYLFTAAILALISYTMNSWVIPHSNKIRLEFENTYIRNAFYFRPRNVHRQVRPGEFFYFESYNNQEKAGFRFSYEKVKNGTLESKIMADMIRWDSISGKWRLENYFIRDIDNLEETIREGKSLDTTFAFHPDDFNQRMSNIETLDNSELNAFIEQEKMRGSDNIEFYEVEKYRRSSVPFATFILTLIGVSVASRKIRGGVGLQIVFGLFLSFSYIFFMQVSNTFATYGGLHPFIAVWIPNIIFAGIAVILLKNTQR